MDPDNFQANSRLRASDADRDRAASVLNEALAEGRLTAEEHSQRLDSIYAARTHAEIAPIIDDLPARSEFAAPALRPAGTVASGGSSRPVIAIFGGATRKGAWRVPHTSTVVTVFGGAELDLRYATLPAREITIRAFAVFGGMEITVPPEMHVIDSGIAIFGGRDVSGESVASARPDAPVLNLTGACIFGGIGVKHKARKNKRD
jgi:Domain of unknown function (DUF1707)/Cell wall-active antibiotics response 4TMS YvqF